MIGRCQTNHKMLKNKSGRLELEESWIYQYSEKM